MLSALLAFLLIAAPARATLPAIEEILLAGVPLEAKAKLPPKPTLEQLAAAVPDESKPGVISKLGVLHEAAIKLRDEPTILELGRAYFALKDFEHASVAGVQSVQLAPKKTDGVLLAGFAYRNSGDYEAATNAAKMALKIDPNDTRAQDLYAFSAGRGKRSSKDSISAADAQEVEPKVFSAYSQPVAKKPLISAVPDITTAYVGNPGKKGSTKRPTRWQTTKAVAKGLWIDQDNVWGDSTSKQDRKRVDALLADLKTLPSMKELASRSGGWDALLDKVTIRVGPQFGGSHAYARPLLPHERLALGKKSIIVIAPNTLQMPDEAVIPIISHELSHASDHVNGKLSGLGTQIISEYHAFRWQSLAYEDISKRSSPKRRKELAKDSDWQELQFTAQLWEDDLLRRFGRKGFPRQFSNPTIRAAAGRAAGDLASGKTSGKEHLNFHIYRDTKEGLYRFTQERDLADLPADQITSEMRANRGALLKRVNEMDTWARKAYGYELK